jgi:inner membrane protein
MNPITHALAGWSLAEAVPGLGRRERGAIVLASLAPDLDGFGLPFELLTRETTHPLLWWTDYHHILGHNLLFAVVIAVISAFASRMRRVVVGIVAFVAVHLHLAGDLVGSRGPDGYQWPIPYLHPFSDQPQLVWSGQWALNAWPNVAITVVLLVATFVLAWHRGYSPVGLVSARTDAAFLEALYGRFPRRAV